MTTTETLIDFKFQQIKALQERIQQLEEELRLEKLKNLKHSQNDNF